MYPPYPVLGGRDMKYCVILELDGVLGRIEHDKGFIQNPPKDCVQPSGCEGASYSPQARTIFQDYVLSCRPGVREFLKFVTSVCHVTVWTRLPKSVTTEMVHFLFLGLPQPRAILSVEDCMVVTESWPQSERPCPVEDCHLLDHPCPGHPVTTRPNLTAERTFVRRADHPAGKLRLKVLHKTVWGQPKFSNRFITLNASNTVLVDSSPESAILNPRYSAIFPFAYNGKHTDKVLLVSVARFIKDIVMMNPSVPQYLKDNGFAGQRLDRSPRAIGFETKVKMCARYMDPSLLLPDPFYVPSKHYQTGDDYFTPRRVPSKLMPRV